MKIAIIGAGWFGCHLALTLQNDHEVNLFEKENDIFTGASGHNQNRLHLGFHYPRSYETRLYAKEGYEEFLTVYGDLCESIDNNLYAIADKISLVDYKTYLQIMDATGLSYKEIDPKIFGLSNVTGCIKVQEKLILTHKAKDFFKQKLRPRFNYDFKKEQIEDFDIVLNCSSQMFMSCESWDLLYEPCIMLNYYCKVDYPAVTIMDGPLCTIYPKNDNIYTLYSVAHSPLAISSSMVHVREIEEGNIIDKFEEVIKSYIPNFNQLFIYCGYETSLRVSINDNTDLRVPKISRDGKLIHILPSKIDNIFHAEREIKKLL